MQFKDFRKVMVAIQEGLEKERKLYDLDVDVTGLTAPYIEVLLEMLVREYNDEEAGWIDYFCWELDFGKNWLPGRVTDEFGRDIKLENLYDLWSFLESQQDCYWECDDSYKEGEIVGVGRHRGLTYFIFKRTTALCAYINVTGTEGDGAPTHEWDLDLDDGKCVTWAENFVSGLDLVDPNTHHWFIGWYYDNKKPIVDIARECRRVIDTLAKEGE